MDVVSMGQLSAGGLVWQPRPGVFVLTVACKATFRLLPGVSPLAEAQDEILARDVCFDGDEHASVYAPSDLAPYKRVADVVLVGSAFAPGGQPARSIVATLQVGEIQKSIAVHADRAFAYDGRLVEGPAFTRASLRWERAAGGGDTANPVGVSFDAPADASGRIALPNLQPPWQSVSWPGDRFDSIGFGPIAPWWPARAFQLHRHLAGWAHDRWFERPLPADIDPRYFNAAPADQQMEGLPPDARLVLENLHPDHPRLVTNLARVRPQGVAERPGRAPEAIELTPDTLWIDTDRGVATLTFRGSTQLARADEAGRVVISTEPAPRRARMRTATLDASAMSAMGAMGGIGGAALPFAPARREPLPTLPFAGTPFSPGPVEAIEQVEEIEPEPESEEEIDPPTVPPAAAAPSAAPPREKWGDEQTATIDVERLRREREALPFAAATGTQPPPALGTQPPPALGTQPPPALGTLPPRGTRPARGTGTIPMRETRPPPARGTIPPPPGSGGGGALPAMWARGASTPAPAPVEEEGPEIETLRPQQLAEAPAFRAPLAPRLASFGGVVPAETPPPFAPAGAPPFAPVASLPFAPAASPPFAPSPEVAPASPPPGPPAPPLEAPPLAVEAYAAARAAFWQPDGDARAAFDGALTSLGIDEDAYRAGEERLLEALAAEAREGRATLARALRAAIRAAVRAGEAP